MQDRTLSATRNLMLSVFNDLNVQFIQCLSNAWAQELLSLNDQVTGIGCTTLQIYSHRFKTVCCKLNFWILCFCCFVNLIVTKKCGSHHRSGLSYLNYFSGSHIQTLEGKVWHFPSLYYMLCKWFSVWLAHARILPHEGNYITFVQHNIIWTGCFKNQRFRWEKWFQTVI